MVNDILVANLVCIRRLLKARIAYSLLLFAEAEGVTSSLLWSQFLSITRNGLEILHHRRP